MPETPSPLPEFVTWPSFPFEGDLRVKPLDSPVDHEPPREGEDAGPCVACSAPDESYIWVSERWRVRALDRPSGLPMVLILESRSHLDLGDLPNMLAAELGVMTVRLERAVRSLDGVARVHVNRWGDGAAHLHLWFLARPRGQLQLRGSFLPLWDDILPPIPESRWREDLALVAAWLAEFGGRSIAEPPHIEWQSPARFTDTPTLPATTAGGDATLPTAGGDATARTTVGGAPRAGASRGAVGASGAGGAREPAGSDTGTPGTGATQSVGTGGMAAGSGAGGTRTGDGTAGPSRPGGAAQATTSPDTPDALDASGATAGTPATGGTDATGATGGTGVASSTGPTTEWSEPAAPAPRTPGEAEAKRTAATTGA